ncbi:MAG: hypothetical protein AAF902_14770 [Chloroflexota bacterium]
MNVSAMHNALRACGTYTQINSEIQIIYITKGGFSWAKRHNVLYLTVAKRKLLASAEHKSAVMAPEIFRAMPSP